MYVTIIFHIKDDCVLNVIGPYENPDQALDSIQAIMNDQPREIWKEWQFSIMGVDDPSVVAPLHTSLSHRTNE